MVSTPQRFLGSLLQAAERSVLPDPFIRWGIRNLLRQRLRGLHDLAQDDPQGYTARFVEQLNHYRIAEDTDLANEQHYQLPATFFEAILGPRLKYSACYWDQKNSTLSEAETAMLRLTCQRAEVEDGMKIMDLGCGWGSLSLWLAEHYPRAHITAVSNSREQGRFILQRSKALGIANLRFLRHDVNDLALNERFDRILSVEMFEHVRNYPQLFSRLKEHLPATGKLFVHIFSHRQYPYFFETEGKDNWMGRYFFSGGTMPSRDLFQHCQNEFHIEKQWELNGLHYTRTLEAWLKRLDEKKREIQKSFSKVYGLKAASLWLQRWRIFLMACAELFAFKGGHEWGVSHYRLRKNGTSHL